MRTNSRDGGFAALCMNYVEGGRCHLLAKACLLGAKGASAKNQDGECPIHGQIDVWVMQNDDLLISDIGSPSEEPKQSVALGINQPLAESIAHSRSAQTGAKVLTTQRRCLACANLFWMSEHSRREAMAQEGVGNICPTCTEKRSGAPLPGHLDRLRHWCG
jgi:hypothetical protein